MKYIFTRIIYKIKENINIKVILNSIKAHQKLAEYLEKIPIAFFQLGNKLIFKHDNVNGY